MKNKKIATLISVIVRIKVEKYDSPCLLWIGWSWNFSVNMTLSQNMNEKGRYPYEYQEESYK